MGFLTKNEANEKIAISGNKTGSQKLQHNCDGKQVPENITKNLVTNFVTPCYFVTFQYSGTENCRMCGGIKRWRIKRKTTNMTEHTCGSCAAHSENVCHADCVLSGITEKKKSRHITMANNKPCQRYSPSNLHKNRWICATCHPPSTTADIEWGDDDNNGNNNDNTENKIIKNA